MNLKEAKYFFEKYFNAKSNSGYHNPNTDFYSYFLTFEDGARLEIMKRPQMKDDEKAINRTGFIHIAFSVGSKEKVDLLTGIDIRIEAGQEQQGMGIMKVVL